MAKRFTDTAKWSKRFFRGLEPKYKLFMLYLFDECDNAGIWEVEVDVASLKIGEQLDEKTALENFGEKIIVFDKGNKWFIPAFIDFQYGVLNPENRAHKSALQILSKHNLLDKENKPLTSPLQGAMDKDKDKAMVKEKDMDKEKGAHLFSKSEYINRDLFVSQFCDPKYDLVDIESYYESVRDWSASKGEKRKDWIATARTFMSNDKSDGKLRLKNKDSLVQLNARSKQALATMQEIENLENQQNDNLKIIQ